MPSIGAAQSLTLTFQTVVNDSGILYNTATVPGDTVSVCTSVPALVCAGDEYTFTLTAAPSRSTYQWFRTVGGTITELTGQTTNVLTIKAVGEYSLAIDNVTGQCPDFSCCPFIIEEVSPVGSFSLATTSPTCSDTVAQTNGSLKLTGLSSTTATPLTYQVAQGGTSFGTATLLTPTQQTLPVGGVLSTVLAGGTYRVRVYNASGCYQDGMVVMLGANCGCPADVCVPFVVSQTKRARRIGDQ